jgi:5'-3' exonuclease
MYGVPPLYFEDQFTAGLYGYIVQLAKYIKNHELTHLLIMDDTRPYKRAELFPEYKGDRKVKDDDFLKNFQETKTYCNDFLQRTKIPVIKVLGYEADDLETLAVEKYHNSFDEIVIITNDSDAYQLLKYENVVIDKGKSGIYTKADYDKEYDLPLEDWWKIGALAGTHNAVPQLLPRCGEKTALKIIKNSIKWNEVYTTNKEGVDIRRRLIELPFDREVDDTIFELKQPQFRAQNVLHYLNTKYGINATVTMEIAMQRLSTHINNYGVNM